MIKVKIMKFHINVTKRVEIEIPDEKLQIIFDEYNEYNNFDDEYKVDELSLEDIAIQGIESGIVCTDNIGPYDEIECPDCGRSYTIDECKEYCE